MNKQHVYLYDFYVARYVYLHVGFIKTNQSLATYTENFFVPNQII